MIASSKILLIDENLKSICPAIMKTAAKSFHFASLFFSSEQKTAAQYLYSWCRYCDDKIDLAPTLEASQESYVLLLRKTEEALDFTKPIQPVSEEDYIFLALQKLCMAYDIPKLYPMELLAGLHSDATFKPFSTTEDLLLYGYRVASIVGLMMSHVMGVSDERALHHAVSAGMAMQLTNISRDLVEDYERNRFYLPLSWTTHNRWPVNKLELVEESTRLAPRLLGLAQEFYDQGRLGLSFLPFRSACAVSVAIEIYSQIGNRVLKRKERAWTSRVYVSTFYKIVYGIKGLANVILSSLFSKKTTQKVYSKPTRTFLFEEWSQHVVE